MRVKCLIAMLAALLLCAPPAQPRAQDAKKVLKIGWEQDPQTLSPFLD